MGLPPEVSEHLDEDTRRRVTEAQTRVSIERLEAKLEPLHERIKRSQGQQLLVLNYTTYGTSLHDHGDIAPSTMDTSTELGFYAMGVINGELAATESPVNQPIIQLPTAKHVVKSRDYMLYWGGEIIDATRPTLRDGPIPLARELALEIDYEWKQLHRAPVGTMTRVIIGSEAVQLYFWCEREFWKPTKRHLLTPSSQQWLNEDRARELPQAPNPEYVQVCMMLGSQLPEPTATYVRRDREAAQRHALDNLVHTVECSRSDIRRALSELLKLDVNPETTEVNVRGIKVGLTEYLRTVHPIVE